MEMTVFDFCFSWNWEHDADFVSFVEKACKLQALSLLQVRPSNLNEVLESLHKNQVSFRVFFERTSEEDERFLPLVRWSLDHPVYYINSYELSCKAWNKALMHLSIGSSLLTPYTIVLPSFQEQQTLPSLDFTLLGDRFNIKPAHGGGGEGVIIGATSLNEVNIARQKYPADNYLLQAFVTPTSLNSRQAWFRVIYCAGRVYPCWWDTKTHVYSLVTPKEESNFSLGALRQIITSIAGICQLELFSSEIALDRDGQFVVVDYVNDPIDLRLKSKAYDGIPDEIVEDIAKRLIAVVIAHRFPPSECKALLAVSGKK